MAVTFDQLLNESLRYLGDLKQQGARFVEVSPETLRTLQNRRPPAASLTSSAAPTNVSPSRAPFATQPTVRPLTSVTAAGTTERLRGAALETAMSELRARAHACVKCSHLAQSRKNVVFGVGNLEASLMFVGEAPGADEDAAGEPFVGKAGQLLTRIIETMGFARKDVYIANILKCRPDTPGQTTGNRKPLPDEMKTCSPYLLAQIDLIRPKVMVALGATAIQGLLGEAAAVSGLRGKWQTFRDIPLMPTYHPAYLLRNQSLSEKRKVWEDMLLVMERLGMTISEKQRGFFSRP